jgi:CRISPR-associated endoribonuclease Cas6/Csy4 subtype I-F
MELIFKHYLDIVLAKQGLELGTKALFDMKSIIKKVHYWNRNNRALALSFPNYREGEEKSLGNIVRIFSDKEEDLNIITSDIKKTWNLTDLKLSDVKEFKITSKTTYYEYAKFNVPGKNNKNPSLKVGYREERLAKADNYPFILIESHSTNQSFSLIIQKKEAPLIQGKINNYGLSNGQNRISLPENID